ncbi:unnamed protein product [Symbiodinium microadriaticum]|nr:unnamed protein product [Symbiodinium microadriaticum]CAE7913448.1 unnamed protein product [Symbiodinium sp. KB8]
MHAVQAVCEQESDVWLVWCFEHCCKAEHRQVYDELKDVATDTGCKFVHHKKCVSFVNWLEGRSGSIVLVADWREAKPIVDWLNNQEDGYNLRMTVLAQSEKIFRRASAWASNQKTGADILVMPGFSRPLVEEMVASRTHAVQATEVASEGGEILVAPLPMPLSLPSLLKAVQDPGQSALLEKIILQHMWQTYED